MPVPERPKIYHIVHGDRLASIIAEGGLHCDAIMAKRTTVGTTIGMSSIKERRLTWTVPCYPDTRVGDYVPFYFCPRSVMLHRIHVNQGKADDSDLAYSGGQEGIVHLEADLRQVVDWARLDGRNWAFSTGSAAAAASHFHTDLSQLGTIDWAAVQAHYWSNVREFKQAEFLIHRFLPWHLITRIGVNTPRIRRRVVDIIANAAHQPTVATVPSWYY